MRQNPKSYSFLTLILFILFSSGLPAQISRQNQKKARRSEMQGTQQHDQNLSAKKPTWTCLGPSGMPRPLSTSNNSGVGQIHRIEFDPFYDGVKNQTVYACSSFGGLWRSEDDGKNWSNVNTDKLPSTSVADVCINPFDRNEIFICSGYADGGLYTPWGPNWTHVIPIYTTGIYRSKNYGKVWEDISTGLMEDFSDEGGYCRKMAINPFNPDQIFIVTTKGIYATNNATTDNVKWKNVFEGNKKGITDFRGLAFKPDDSNTIYASSKDIFRSNNGGKNWESITGEKYGLDIYNLPDSFAINRINIAVSPLAPERIYAYISGARKEKGKKKNGAYIAVFENNKWRIVETRWSSGLTYFDESWIAIAVSPVDADFVVYGNTRVLGSEKIDSLKFSAWSPYSGKGFHADVHDLEFQPNVKNPKLFCGNHGGVSVKTFPDKSPRGWENMNEGLEVATIWSFDDSEINEGHAIIGTQDNGTLVYIDTLGNNWHFLRGGDGYSARIDDLNPDHAYFSAGDRSLTLFDFAAFKTYGQTGKLPKDKNNNKGIARTTKTFPMINHPESGDLLFGFTEVFQKNIATPMVTTPVEDIWQVKSDIIKLQPVGWRRQITEISICKTQPDVIYIITGGQQNPPGSRWQLRSSLYKSTTGLYEDSNKNYFSRISYPGEKYDKDTLAILTGIATDPGNPDRIFICYTGLIGQFRVWYSENGGENWNNLDPKGIFKNIPVNAIAYQENTSDRLYIGTDFGLYTMNRYTDWEKVKEFPGVRITELKINKNFNKLRVATFGRGLWEGPLSE